jgi:hypothetical protein
VLFRFDFEERADELRREFGDDGVAVPAQSANAITASLSQTTSGVSDGAPSNVWRHSQAL